jgi:5-formyltetrahydrofolate cyclo-ligase
MKKSDIRSKYRSLRKSLTKEEVNTMSQAIVKLLFRRIPIHRYSVIHVFLPITKNNEPDTQIIINVLQKDFPSEIYISKSLESGDMLHVPYSNDIHLEHNQWGISEPSDLSNALDSDAFFKKYATEEILVLIPLLAFDLSGNRVGYGKGFYDKFLSHSHQNTAKVGLSLLDPVSEITDTYSHDIKLDLAITPERIYAFNS